MLMGNCLLLILWCLLDKSFVSPMHSSAQSKLGKEHHRGLRDQRRHGLSGLHRVKRGWVWNQFFVLEEYMGTDPQYVGKLHSDLDKGDNLVKYTLSGEGVGSIFTVEPTTGDIHALRSLDREEKPYYALRAQAVDVLTGRPLEPESEFIIKVQDINDNEPKFLEGPYSASVPEMSPVGTYVIQVTATDADDPTYGNSARIVYSILHGQPYFSVDPKTGVIKIALPNMDREVKETYQVLIQAKDMGGQLGGLAGTTIVNITLTDVNDNPPRFAKSIFHLRVPESAPVGSSVGKIKAHDLDLGKNAEVEYSIVPGDSSSMFDIYTDEQTQEGIVVLRKPLDYENRKAYSFKVEASNPHLDSRFLHLGPYKDSATVKVSVMDVDEPPLFSRSSYNMETYEDTPMGIVIGAVTAEDLDIGDSPIRYSIEWRKDDENYFDIDPVEGTITTSEALDRERTAKHNITVVATKVNNPLLYSRVSVTISVLDVNEFPPELSHPYEAFVCEDAKVGQVIEILSATDRDMPHVGHRFFFKSPRDIRNRNFTIRDYGNNTAGVVTRKAGFRRREKSMYLIPVVVEDSGYPIQSSTGTLSVRVCACDEGGSVLSCSAEAVFLAMGLSTGALVAILLCILILLVMVVLYVALKRHKKKDALMSSKEDVRDNVIHYDDEGGGEEDTNAFDIGTLRNPKALQETLPRRDVQLEAELDLDSEDNEDIRAYIQQRLQENHTSTSAPPYDSLATYAYEGEGSVAESLSSIESWVLDPEEDYRSIQNWGPRFKTLAGIFSQRESIQGVEKRPENKGGNSREEGSEERPD
ncbi:cadherin-12a [Pygocentrus nattereri]|uniref:Cadherin-12 n=1 Tax=Pygocentrus nattereri TaxID=42514 RepID=A0A3B4CWZ1_PYGNA|nr:cadherin-12a [Pygocentrus nattereri]